MRLTLQRFCGSSPSFQHLQIQKSLYDFELGIKLRTELASFTTSVTNRKKSATFARKEEKRKLLVECPCWNSHRWLNNVFSHLLSPIKGGKVAREVTLVKVPHLLLCLSLNKMSLFKSLSRAIAKVMRQAIVILLVLQLFIQVKANSAENSSQPFFSAAYQLSSSLCYENFMIGYKYNHPEKLFLFFWGLSEPSCILKILGLSIENDKFCDMITFKNSSLTKRSSDVLNVPSTEKEHAQQVRICS